MAQFYGAGNTNGSALCKTLHGRVLSIMSAADFALIESAKTDNKFASLIYFFPLKCVEATEMLSTLGNMLPFKYRALDTK